MLLAAGDAFAVGSTAPTGGGGACTNTSITDPVSSYVYQGEQSALDSGIYTCTGSNTYVPEALIVGSVDQTNTAVSCTTTNAGMIEYTSGGGFQGCNGTSFGSLASSGNVALSAITAATTTSSIDSTNNAQTWKWGTLSTQTALTLSTSSMTGGALLSLQDTAAVATSTGYVLSVTDAATGVGYGVYSAMTATANTGYAGYFTSSSTAGDIWNTSTAPGAALYAAEIGAGNATPAIAGVNASSNDDAVGVFGNASTGVFGISSDSNGGGVWGRSTSSSGSGTGGSIISSGNTGAGGTFRNTSLTGANYGVVGNDASGTGYGGYFTNTSTGWALAATGTSYFNGNVGIGTTSPTQMLQANGNIYAASYSGTAPTLIVGDFEYGMSAIGGGLYLFSNATPGTISFVTKTSGGVQNTNMIITSTGSVGIGTSSPGAQLDLISTTTNGGMALRSTLSGLVNTGYAGYFSNTVTTTGYALYANGSTYLNGTTTVMGNVVVGGNITVGNTVSIYGGSGEIFMGLFQNGVYASSSISAAYPPDMYNLIVQDTATTNGEGQGINWEVKNSSANGQYATIGAVSVAGAGTYSPAIVFDQSTGANAYNERMRIDSTGYVGIGSTSPGAQLDLVSTSTGPAFALRSTLSSANNTGYAGYFNNSATTAGYAIFANSATTTSGGGVYSFMSGANNIGTAVAGVNGGGGAGGNAGVLGLSNSTGSASGVAGQETGTANTGFAGFFTNSATSGANFGVYGNDASATGYGGYFINTSTGYALFAQGNIYLSGTTTVNGTLNVMSCNGCGAGGGTTALSSITSATTTGSIDSANNAITWNWGTLSTQTALTLTTSSMTGGALLSLQDTAAVATSTGYVLSVTDATTGKGYGIYSAMTATTNTGYAGYFGSSSTGTGYAIYATISGLGNSGYAGYFSNTSTNGNAIYADNDSGTSVVATSNFGVALYAQSSATPTNYGSPAAVFIEQTGGGGAFPVVGLAVQVINNTNGQSEAIYAGNIGGGSGILAQTNGAAGGDGVAAETSATTNSSGIYGYASATTGDSYGAYFQADSVNAAYGLYSIEDGAANTGYSGYFANTGIGAVNYGIYATSASSSGYGGYFANTSTGYALYVSGGCGGCGAVVGSSRNAKMSITAAGTSGTFSADQIIVATGLTGQFYSLGNYSQTINLSGTGAGGMDTGAAPVSGFVSLYAIYNPSTPATSILACAVATSTASVYGGSHMPSGYTASALIGIWPTNASSQFVPGLTLDRRFQYQSFASIFTGTTGVGSMTSQSVSAGAPAAARTVDITMGSTQTGGSMMYASVSGDSTGTGAQSQTISLTSGGNNYCVGGLSSSYKGCGTFNAVPMITSHTVYWKEPNINAGDAMFVSGYSF